MGDVEAPRRVDGQTTGIDAEAGRPAQCAQRHGVPGGGRRIDGHRRVRVGDVESARRRGPRARGHRVDARRADPCQDDGQGGDAERAGQRVTPHEWSILIALVMDDLVSDMAGPATSRGGTASTR